MQLNGMGPLSISVFVSLLVAVALLAIRIVVMQRVQQRRQRENRQETERLKSLVAAYRSLAGSFSPPTGEHRGQMEEALSDVILFGSVAQVEMAAQCARALARGEPVPYQPLIESLRSDLRTQLGLDAIPKTINLPAAGPGRVNRGRGDGEGGAGGNRAGGGAAAGGAGGGGGGMASAGGLGVGLIAGSGLDGGERQS